MGEPKDKLNVKYVQTDSGLKISNFGLKQQNIDEEYDSTDISFRFNVLNGGDDREISFLLQGIDFEGYEVFSTYVFADVMVGAEKSVTERLELVSLESFLQVVSWQIEG